MKVYFVRHGESVLTEKNHQTQETPLNEEGISQSSLMAERFAGFPIGVILTSPYARAEQTADILQKIVPVSVIKSDLLVERKMPSSFNGRSVDDPQIQTVHQILREHFYEQEWHYEDEENFTDLYNRAKAALDFIID